jgi:hypothetical protein
MGAHLCLGLYVRLKILESSTSQLSTRRVKSKHNDSGRQKFVF